MHPTERGSNVLARQALRHFVRRPAKRRLSDVTDTIATLQAMARELRGDLAGNVAVLATELDAKGEDTTPSQHPADVASDLYAREELVAGELELERALDEVEDALARLAEHRYGLCVECGRAIPPERLTALPQAARCIECQRRAERSRPR